MTRFVKHDSEKERPLQLPARACIEASEVLTYGIFKYDEYNWKHCEEPKRMLDAAMRHLLRHIAHLQGEGDGIDESGHRHVAHALASLMMYVDLTQAQESEPDGLKSASTSEPYLKGLGHEDQT